MSLQVSSELNSEQRLWRYMSLDKLIDLLSSSTLYMATPEQFKASDPLEGQDHPQVTRISAQMMQPSFDQHRALHAQIDADTLKGLCDPDAVKRYKDQFAAMPMQMDKSRQKLFNSVRFSCWHANDAESEAMWKLYGDSGKSVAIVTTVGSLAKALHVDGLGEEVDIARVKYLNFAREYPPAELKDFTGRLTVTKRLAYQHEQEVRLTVRPTTANPRDWENPAFGKSEPTRLPVDLKNLIHEVHISPYPAQPFESSVRTICGLYGIKEERIHISSLLTYRGAQLAQHLS